MCTYQQIPEYGKLTCEELFNCCSCGGNECGCRYYFDCNACEHCLESED